MQYRQGGLVVKLIKLILKKIKVLVKAAKQEIKDIQTEELFRRR